jgi:hypothetical protein
MRWQNTDCRAALLIRNNHCGRNGPACAGSTLIIAVMSPPEGRRWTRRGDAPEFYQPWLSGFHP